MTIDAQYVLQMRTKISKIRDQLSENEAKVRYYILNPLLNALGWDTTDPDLVIPEQKTSEGYPDYILTHPDGNGKKIMMIEAKKLSEGLEKHIHQLGGYCYAEGTRYGLLTNGSIYAIIKSWEEGLPTEKRIIWKTDIENDSIQSIVRNLNTIDRNNIDELERMVSKINLMDKAWEEITGQPDRLADSLVPLMLRQLSEKKSHIYTEEELKSFLLERIETLISPDENTFDEEKQGVTEYPQYTSRTFTKMYIGKDPYRITAANQILVNTAEWLIKKGILTEKHLPIDAGYKRYLVNRENKNKLGGTLPGGKELFNGWWIMLNLSTENCVKHSRRLLTRFDIDPTILKIE